MAINPLTYQQPPAFTGEIDWSPLARIGEQLRRQQEEQEAAQLISQLFGQQQAQQPMALQAAPATARAPAPAPAVSPRDLAPPDMRTPNERVAGGFDRVAIPGPTALDAAPAPQAASPLDTAQWPAGPVGAPQAVAAGDPMEAYSRASANIESGGDYRKIGPVTKGDRPYGKYQVMGANVRPWTREVLGREMSPTEFLNSPEAQEAVYRGKFGQYVQKYGPEGAARAWFAGERGMNNPNARDVLGTSVADYSQKFTAGLPPEITGGASQPTAFDRTVQNLASPNVPARDAGIGREQLAALYKNPLTRPVANAFLQKMLDPGTYEFMQAGDNIVRYNKRDGSYSVIPSGKVHVVDDDKALVTSEGKVVYGGGGGGQYGKLPANYRWTDPNDKSKGITPITGSSVEQIGQELAPRVGLAKSFISTIPQIRQRIDRGDVGIENTGNHVKALANLGEPGETKRMMDAGAEALIRMLTGAGMPASEAAETALQYRLTARDDVFTVKSKLEGLERHLYHIGDVLGRGRGGGNLLQVATPATPDRAALEAELRKRGAIK